MIEVYILRNLCLIPFSDIAMINHAETSLLNQVVTSNAIKHGKTLPSKSTGNVQQVTRISNTGYNAKQFKQTGNVLTTSLFKQHTKTNLWNKTSQYLNASTHIKLGKQFIPKLLKLKATVNYSNNGILTSNAEGSKAATRLSVRKTKLKNSNPLRSRLSKSTEKINWNNSVIKMTRGKRVNVIASSVINVSLFKLTTCSDLVTPPLNGGTQVKTSFIALQTPITSLMAKMNSRNLLTTIYNLPRNAISESIQLSNKSIKSLLETPTNLKSSKPLLKREENVNPDDAITSTISYARKNDTLIIQKQYF